MTTQMKQQLPLMIIFLLLLLLPMSALAAKDAAELKAAVANGGTIELSASFELGENLTITKDTTINGNGYTITRADGYTKALFTVNAGATLTLGDGLVIDGGNNWAFDTEAYAAARLTENQYTYADFVTAEAGAPVATAAMIANKGTLNLKKVTIKNHYSTAAGIVTAGVGSTTNLSGATLTHNTYSGSGVIVNASGKGIIVNLYEGTTIEGNHVGGNHGLFKIYSGATLNMTGGEIKNNTGVGSNGVVVGLWGTATLDNGEVYRSTFNMSGGSICSNSGVRGGANGRNSAIYLHKNSAMNMSGGEICHNGGRNSGGIDSNQTTTKLNISGGSVTDNNRVSEGNADITGSFAEDGAAITGGVFTQDVSTWVGEDCELVLLNNGQWGVYEENKVYQITYVLDGGKLAEDDYPVKFVKGMAYQLPNPTKEGYTFQGWTGGKAQTPTKDLKVTSAAEGDVTYTANWKEIVIPKTGDESNLLLWAAMLVMGAALLAVTRRQLGQAK